MTIPDKCPKSECVFMNSPTLCYRCAVGKGYIEQNEDDHRTYVNVEEAKN